MPRLGPGEDNISGDRYTMDLGVEPDLGNLLQNLQVANDFLDQAEQRFRTISDVVGTTTQRLAAATRQTQLLASETQRLQNSYAAIASSTMGIANMGGGMGMGVGAPMAGYSGYGGPGGYGGPTIGGGPGGGTVVQTMPSSVARGDQNASYIPPQSTIGPMHPSMRFTEAEQAKELFLGQRGSPGGLLGGRSALGGVIGQIRAGYDAGSWGAARAAIPAPPPGLGLSGATATQGGSMLAGVGGLAARFGPYAAAGGYVASKAYQAWAGAQAESRRIAGLTGGEAGVAGMMGSGGVPGSISLSTRARIMGLLNPGVDYGEVQERALGAGFTGESYGQARDYLFETYQRGLGTTIDQIDLYVEAVDKSGASTSQLVSSMDSLRATASNTNVSISALMSNMKAQVESLTGMGLSGGAAVYQATQGAQAFAQDPYASLNPNLREAGGYGITSPFMQVQAAGQLGIPLGGMAPYLAQHPGANVNVLGENAARETLISRLGFREGQTVAEMDSYIASRGWGAYNADGTTIIGSILEQLGVLPVNLSGADYGTIKTWIWTTINRRPMRAQARAAKKAMGGVDISQTPGSLIRAGTALSEGLSVGIPQEDGWLKTGLTTALNVLPGGPAASAALKLGLGAGGAANALTIDQGENYVQNTLGLDPNSALGAQLQAMYGQPGAKTSPVLERMLAGEGSEANTYIKTADGRVVRVDEWMRTARDWQGALASGRVQIAHADAATQEALGGRTRGIENGAVMASGGLQFNTAEQEMAAVGPLIDGTRGRAVSENIMGLDDRTIVRLAADLGRAVAENV